MAIETPPRRYRRERRERSPTGYLVMGSLIAIYGLGLLLDNLGLGDVRYYMRHAWPAVLVIVGIVLLIRRDANHNHFGFWGAVAIFGGLWAYAFNTKKASLDGTGWLSPSEAADRLDLAGA